MPRLGSRRGAAAGYSEWSSSEIVTERSPRSLIASRIRPTASTLAVRGSQTAEGEEGRVTPVRHQQVENRPGPGRGTVVEGERDDVLAHVMPLFERGHSKPP